MAYNKKTWQYDDLITETELNRMEEGIEGAANTAEAHASRHASEGEDPITPASIGAEDTAIANNRQIENIGDGVQTGLEVTALEPSEMTVNVQSGIIYMPDGKRLEFDSVTAVSVDAADSTNGRKDIVYVSSNGAIAYLAGNPAPEPVEPTLPNGAIKLAVIDVPAASTTVEQSQITDTRKLKKTLNAHLADYMPHDSELNQYASSKDANGIYTVIDYKRTDGTLYLNSTLSNPDANGNYQTVTWDFYGEDGTTVALTKTWTISYDTDGIPTSKVVA